APAAAAARRPVAETQVPATRPSSEPSHARRRTEDRAPAPAAAEAGQAAEARERDRRTSVPPRQGFGSAQALARADEVGVCADDDAVRTPPAGPASSDEWSRRVAQFARGDRPQRVAWAHDYRVLAAVVPDRGPVEREALRRSRMRGAGARDAARGAAQGNHGKGHR